MPEVLFVCVHNAGMCFDGQLDGPPDRPLAVIRQIREDVEERVRIPRVRACRKLGLARSGFVQNRS